MTTVCICGDGKVYDLGRGEYPPYPPETKKRGAVIKDPKFMVVDAFTCTQEKADELKKKKKKGKK